MEMTNVSSYITLHTTANVAGAPDGTLDTVATDYLLNTRADDAVDLLEKAGAGYRTRANEIEVVVYGTGADGTTATLELYASNEGGARERIASIVYILGTAIAITTGTYRWADTATVTSYHLASGGVNVADSAVNRIVKIGFDAIGYRYLEGRFTAGNCTIARALFRYL